ncbi:MAG: DUF1828 domain-containing protein [Gemmatimonadaceae bacterium]|nr:DUF1828 domain-containing protein [Gemmatimonadaceae bacterium]
MNCSDLTELARATPLAGFRCSQDGDFLRLETPFRYPDGGTIELFVEEFNGVLRVSDYGEAFRFLEKGGLEPLRSPGRRRAIEFAVKLAGAQLDDGVLEISLRDGVDLMPAIVRLGQAMTRVADLSLLVKGTLVNRFSDAVEDYLKTHTTGLEIRRGAEVRGNATSHQVDIFTRSTKGIAVVESLSAITPTGANAQTAFTIQKFADISAIGPGAPSRYTVLDDSSEVWSDSLRKQLTQFSDVIDWERRGDLASALSPAG